MQLNKQKKKNKINKKNKLLIQATQEYLLDLEDKNRDLDLALKDKGEQLEDTKEDIVSAERDLKELKSETTKQKQDLKHTLEMLQLEQSEMENMATQHQQKLQELENIRTDLQEVSMHWKTGGNIQILKDNYTLNKA